MATSNGPSRDYLHARTLPSSFYRDADLQLRLQEAVFPQSWQWLPTWDPQLAPGSWQPVTLLAGALDEPLLQVKATDGQESLLANVCTHRGARLCSRPGQAKFLRCPYHGRRFAHDGRFLQAPGFEQAPDFPGVSEDLARPQRSSWGPLQLTQLLPGQSFAAWRAPLDDRLSFLPWKQAEEQAKGRRSFEVEAHWSLYVENFLEGLHIPFVHPALARSLDLSTYPHYLFSAATLQIGEAANEEDPCFILPPQHPEHGRRIAAFYYWLWPNLMLNVYPWGLSANLVEPLGLRRCRIIYRRYLFPGANADVRGAGGDLDQVEGEDQGIVAEVQRGIRSRLYHGGRYAPQQEQGVFLFHSLLRQAMEACAPDAS